MRVLGIDPGSRLTGFGVIEYVENRQEYLISGCIRAVGNTVAVRLKEIYDGLRRIIDEYEPSEAAIERVFVHKNVASALKLGQARGAALVALASSAIPIYEYAPRQIKQAVVGYGAAEKSQIQHMVQSLLKLSGLPREDASDALAIAICHMHLSKGYILQ